MLCDVLFILAMSCYTGSLGKKSQGDGKKSDRPAKQKSS